MPKNKFFSYGLSFLIFLTFDLMLLGAAVRALDAGLACPDWPLCFSQTIPEFHLGVYMEFIHRSIAGIVAIVFSVLYLTTLFVKSLKPFRWLMTVALFFLLAQIIMGGLTVLKLLAPKIVTLHLALATSFLISLKIVQNQLAKKEATEIAPPRYHWLAPLGLVLVCGQILLGGWVASNYAGTACMDFPTCNGQWFPTLIGPIGAQVVHRLGAYTVATFFIILFFLSLKLSSEQMILVRIKRLSAKMFMIVLSQIAVGIANVLWMVPAWLTVVHLGLALYLLLLVMQLNFLVFNSTNTSD
ncbi:MAG: COX15/CtaA family protein [Bdellovibrionaceae bacterium]|nr:COX15/CtaA family protein [Pseudobdellovibrionaceae bacterium]